MTPKARRNLTFLWSIGDPALAASLGRTLIPVLFGPFSRRQFCNRAGRERPREGARFGPSGEPLNDPIGTLVLGSDPRNIRGVFIAGHVRKWDGTVLGLAMVLQSLPLAIVGGVLLVAGIVLGVTGKIMEDAY